MNKETTFEQVAHLYLRSELKVIFNTATTSETCSITFAYGDGRLYKYIPIFTPFENLIKPTKANKFVAELLGVNEGDEYVMIEKISELACEQMEFSNILSTEGNPINSIRARLVFGGKYVYHFSITDLYSPVAWDYTDHDNIVEVNLSNQPLIQTLLIAAGYNVFQIKDCKYESANNSKQESVDNNWQEHVKKTEFGSGGGITNEDTERLL